MSDITDSYWNSIDEKVPGIMIVTSAYSILNWLYQEYNISDTTQIFTKKIFGNLCYNYFQTHPDKLKVPFAQSEKIAKTYFESHKDYFRGYVKAIGVAGAGSQVSGEDLGDIATFFLLGIEIIKDKEDLEKSKKCDIDSQSICNTQLDCSNIFDEIKTNATNIYSENKDFFNKEYG